MNLAVDVRKRAVGWPDGVYVSHNTVRTHLRHLYAKLGTHRHAEAVARARALGLLAPSPHQGQAARAG